VIRQGDIYWYDFGQPHGSEPGYRRPVAVLQNDLANGTAIHTTIVCTMTTNLRLAAARGNVLLDAGEGNLSRRSVVNVSQLATVDKGQLTDDSYIGSLSTQRTAEIVAGARLFL